MTVPMLADFAVQLACGLAVLLLIAPWRLIPPAFFRTHCLVILGLLVLAALALAGSGGSHLALVAAIVAAVLAYLDAVAWGLGLPRLGVPLTAVIVATCAAILAFAARATEPSLWALNGAARFASAFLMGSTLTAMLLGHHYLTAPAMSIDPLKRFVRCMAGGLVVRIALAALGLAYVLRVSGSTGSVPAAPLFVMMRWGMGLAGAGLATWMAWKTVQIRSTQSATGILYIGMTLVLFGEITALVLSREVGVLF